MVTVLNYSPGQVVSLVLEILKSDGTLIDGYSDGYTSPTINRIFFPSMTTSSLYPLAMTKVDVGLYIHNFVLPIGTTSVGSFIVDGYWLSDGYDPSSVLMKRVLWQVIVNAPFGNYSVSPL